MSIRIALDDLKLERVVRVAPDGIERVGLNLVT
jgi:hypothetical protein